MQLNGPRRTLSIVTPVYYNAASLAELFSELTELERALNERQMELELIFVNDGSGDDSLEQLLRIKAARPTTKVISLTRNFGAVAASKTGFQFVTGDAFTILAADLQDPAAQVLHMVDEWLAGSKYVISVRAARKDPAFTRLFAWLYYKIVDWMVVRGYPQGGFDLMLMDKAMLQYMSTSVKSTNPTVFSYWLGFPPKTLYYTRRERRHGRSRYTLRKRLKFLFDTLTGFSVTPIRVLSAFGVAVAVASFIYGFNLVVAAFRGNVETRGFVTLAVLISFFSGLILIMLGAIGEYLWRVFDAVNNKPESVIDETFL
jgi:polyisoprenyl-phosphate glycosyltransferase